MNEIQNHTEESFPPVNEVGEKLQAIVTGSGFGTDCFESAMKRIEANNPEADFSTKNYPSHDEILGQLRKQIEPADFRSLADLEDDEKIRVKHIVVCTVDEIIRRAEANNWGLCRNLDFVYVYNGTYWNLLSEDKLTEFLGEAAWRMGVKSVESRHHVFRQELYKQFVTIARLSTIEPPAGTILINLQNGTFEITPEGQRLREYRRDDFLTYRLPFAYDEHAQAPIFKAYLDRVLPDRTLQNIIAEFFASVFISHERLKLEKALALYGHGANGKSVMFEVINELFGKENTSNYSLKSLVGQQGDYYRAMLQSKLLNFTTELSGNLEADTFKTLVSGEPIACRLPYGRPFIIRNRAKLVFNCNELPKDVEHTEGFFRRFLIVPFTVTIPEDEQDKALARKIIDSELAGVFVWIMEGLHRLLAQGNYTSSDIVRQQLEQYKKDSNSVLHFLDEVEYQTSLESTVTLKSMFGEYKDYCAEGNYRSTSKKTFADRLRKAGYAFKKTNSGQVVYAEKNVFN